MNFSFNNNSPIYQQLADLMRHAILAEDIGEKEAMPSVRVLSKQYGINPQTVLKATQDLILEGIIEKKRGMGLFVKNGAVKWLREQQRHEFLTMKLPETIEKARILGISREELTKEIDRLFEGE